MKNIIRFIKNNKLPLLGMLLGSSLGVLHWYNYGCYWGTYPLSSEWWVNVCLGGLFGGFFCSLIKEIKA